MMTIEIEMPRDEEGRASYYQLDVPALPAIGTFMESDSQGFRGQVNAVTFWEDEAGNLHLQVRLI